VSRRVWSRNVVNEEALAHWRPLCPKKKSIHCKLKHCISLQSVFFWVVTLCSFVNEYQCFSGPEWWSWQYVHTKPPPDVSGNIIQIALLCTCQIHNIQNKFKCIPNFDLGPEWSMPIYSGFERISLAFDNTWRWVETTDCPAEGRSKRSSVENNRNGCASRKTSADKVNWNKW